MSFCSIESKFYWILIKVWFLREVLIVFFSYKEVAQSGRYFRDGKFHGDGRQFR